MGTETIRVYNNQKYKNRGIKKNVVIAFYLAAVLLLIVNFYIINNSLPFVMDDALYAHIYPENPIDNGNPHNLNVQNEINTYSDIFDSQWNHYFTKNGRSLVHLVVQSFCGLWGKNAFNICSTLVFVCFLLLLGRLNSSLRDFKTFIGWCCVSCFLFFLLIPEPTCLYNGIAYGVNYLWSATACLAFLYLLFRGNLNPWYIKVFFFLLAFVAGWTHEGFVLGIGGGLFVWLWQQHFRINGIQKIGIILFLLGASFMVFSPSNFARAKSLGGDNAAWTEGVLDLHTRIFHIMRASYVWIAGLLLLFLIRRERFSIYMKENLFWLFAWGIAFLFIIAIGALNVRAAFGVDFFAVILLLKLLPHILRTRIEVLMSISSLCMIGASLWVLSVQLKASEQYREMDRALSQSSERDCLVLVEELTPSWWIKRYVCQYKFDELWEDWEERVLKWRYCKNKVLIAQVRGKDETTLLTHCMNKKYKVAGNNPFYKIGNYLYSKESLPPTVEINMKLGERQAYDVISFMKLLVSKIVPVGENILKVSLPSERISFQGLEYSRIELYPYSPRKIDAMDIEY